MAGNLKVLTDQQLINVLMAAKKLDLDKAFLELLEQEMKRRGINTNQ